MKKTLVTLFAAINLTLLYCPAAFALTEDEAAAAVDTQGKRCSIRESVPVVAVRYRLSESRHQAGRYPAFTGHRRFSFARLDALRGIADFPWF